MTENRDVPRDQSEPEDRDRASKRAAATPDGLSGAGRRASDDDEFDFVVTEAHDQQAPQFLETNKPTRRDDDLGVESTADLMEDRAQNEDRRPGAGATHRAEPSPIGDSAPPPPPAPGFSSRYGEFGQDDSYAAPNDTPSASGPQPSPKPQELGPNEIGKLSAEEVASITKNMYADSPYLSEEEKRRLISSIDKADKPFGNPPIEPPKKSRPAKVDPVTAAAEFAADAPRPAMASRQRGVALFMRNYIQIQGTQPLMDNDELKINDREYVLRRKTFSPKVVTAVLGSIFIVLLLIVGSQFVTDTSGGDGQIIGVVVDDMSRPFLQKAVIRFPDLGMSFQSNEEGFFKTGNLPQGNHKLEYTIDGTLIGIDYATVVGGEVTTMVLKPSDVSQSAPSSPANRPAAKPTTTAASSTDQPAQSAATPQAAQPVSTGGSKAAKSPAKSDAKLTLAANIEGARLAIDGNVIGAGNLTYPKLAPGSHAYTVSKDGFESVSGTVNIRSDNTSRLEVTLKPLTQAAKSQAYDADDFLHSGLNSLRDGKYDIAIADLTETINKQPSNAQAYFGRAQAYEVLKKKPEAFDDYLRAAEIFQFGKDYNQAVTSYNKAAEMDQKSIAPLLGRANIYLARGEQIAAVADFEAAIDRDKKNVQALFGLGKARFEQGYYKKAIQHFKDARSLDSENPEIYQYLMLSYMAANDIKNVKKSYEKFWEIASDQQKKQFQDDSRFTAVRRVIDIEG